MYQVKDKLTYDIEEAGLYEICIKTSQFSEKDSFDKEKSDKKTKKILPVSKSSFNDKAIEKFVEYDLNRKKLKNLKVHLKILIHQIN